MDKEYTIQDFLETKVAFGGSFSPDTNNVAFLSNLTGTTQLYLVSRDGGESKQLTDYDEPLSFAIFSPAKNQIMFGMSKGGDEKTQFYLYDIDSQNTKPITNNPDFIYRWGSWSLDGKMITYASNKRNGTDFDVYVMNIENGEEKVVFDQGGWCEPAGFSPSGAKVAVRKLHTFLRNDMYLVDLENNEVELVTPHEGDAEYWSPKWLPDESGFFFTSNEGQDLLGLSFYDTKNKKSEKALDFGWDLSGVSLSRDGSCIAVVLNEDGYGNVTLYDTKTLKPVENQSFPKGIINGVHWSNDGKYLAFNFQSPTKNSDVWVWSKEENKHWQITHSPKSVPEDVFVEPELIHYESFDGLKVPAFVFLPKNHNGKLPAVVNIHGGPEGQYRPIFNSLMQYFVYRGYAVVAPNVRGSIGYGKNYLSLDDRGKRMDSVKDLESLHKYLESRNEIDSSKIALMGGSYGGYMVLAGLTFFPDLWAAGVDIVGMSSLVSFLENTSSWRRALREAEYGYLATDRDLLESISPLNFIGNIKAPLFIIHGKNDPRVPLSEAEQIHAKLGEKGMKSELLVYEDEGHGLAKLKNRLDAYPKVVGFLDSCLK